MELCGQVHPLVYGDSIIRRGNISGLSGTLRRARRSLTDSPKPSTYIEQARMRRETQNDNLCAFVMHQLRDAI
jgi:hypothetical protein